ncbi:hypothetical protein FOA52_003192 [Chlamydomonas sp. UWO 241]|nr:hypothetical protein FOA52_003192 [Chlamydomonas sp. UWO 241]
MHRSGTDASSWGSGFWDESFDRLRAIAGSVGSSVMAGAGPVGPLFNPLDLSFRATGGAGVLYWAGSLYALSDHALPREMNKLTLETVSESAMGGALAGRPNLVASWKIDTPPGASESADTGDAPANQARRLALLSSQQSGPAAVLSFKELDSSGKVVSATEYTMPGSVARLVSDFFVTEHYYVVVQPPLSINLERMATRYTIGDASFAECVTYEPGQAAKLHLIPRGRGGKGGSVINLPPMVVPRLVQAAELGSNQIAIDVVAQKGLHYHKDMGDSLPGFYKGQPKPELMRVVVDTSAGIAAAPVVLSHRATELGVHAAAPKAGAARLSSVLFAAASASEDRENWGPPQVVTKLRVPTDYCVPDASKPAAGMEPLLPCSRVGAARAGVTSETWRAGPRAYLGPLTLVPKAVQNAEDDVWVVTTVHTAGSAHGELIVLDGAQLQAGPVCSVQLPHALPFPRALTWVPRYLGPGRTAPAGWKPRVATRVQQ